MEALLQHEGVDLSIGEKDGYTPLHGAGFQGRAAIARMLLAAGVAVDDRHSKVTPSPPAPRHVVAGPGVCARPPHLPPHFPAHARFAGAMRGVRGGWRRGLHPDSRVCVWGGGGGGCPRDLVCRSPLLPTQRCSPPPPLLGLPPAPGGAKLPSRPLRSAPTPAPAAPMPGEPQDKFTPLHRACWGREARHADTVKALIDGGADFWSPGPDGKTPLQMAAHSKEATTVLKRALKRREKAAAAAGADAVEAGL